MRGNVGSAVGRITWHHGLEAFQVSWCALKEKTARERRAEGSLERGHHTQSFGGRLNAHKGD